MAEVRRDVDGPVLGVDDVKIVASMIVKNELGRYLPLAIAHLLSYCDEVRVLDDNSTDGTFEYLDGIERVEVIRNSGLSFYEYESKARNHLLEWTLEAKPTYVLSIDADEFVGDPLALQLAARRGGSVYTLNMEEVWAVHPTHLEIRIDGQWGPRRLCPILWRPPSGGIHGEWAIPDRKLACGREPLAVRRTRTTPSQSSVLHFGWAREVERVARAERYFEHDKGQFHQDRHLQSILWPPERVRLQRREWPVGMSSVQEELTRITSA